MSFLYNTFPKTIIKSVEGNQDIRHMDDLPMPHHGVTPIRIKTSERHKPLTSCRYHSSVRNPVDLSYRLPRIP